MQQTYNADDIFKTTNIGGNRSQNGFNSIATEDGQSQNKISGSAGYISRGLRICNILKK